MAPIRKGDGTPLEIPGVSEVRSGDGRVFFEGDAIPDSAIAQFDARQISASDGDTLSTWPESLSSDNWDATASGNPTYVESAINGNPAVSFGGDEDYFDSPANASGDYVVFVVADSINLTQNNTIISNNSSLNGQIWFSNGSGDWRIFNGNTNITGTGDATNIFTAHFTTDASDDTLRQDQSQTGSGDAGSGTLDDLRIGANGETPGNLTDGNIGYIEIHEAPVSNGLTTREQEIATDWGY